MPTAKSLRTEVSVDLHGGIGRDSFCTRIEGGGAEDDTTLSFRSTLAALSSSFFRIMTN